MLPAGKIGIQQPKTRMNRIPKTHGGTTVVVMEMTDSPRSSGDSALLAIRKPSQIPIPAETNEALVKSRTVLGRRSKTMSPTLYEPDALVMTVDRPRFPRENNAGSTDKSRVLAPPLKRLIR